MTDAELSRLNEFMDVVTSLSRGEQSHDQRRLERRATELVARAAPMLVATLRDICAARLDQCHRRLQVLARGKGHPLLHRMDDNAFFLDALLMLLDARITSCAA